MDVDVLFLPFSIAKKFDEIGVVNGKGLRQLPVFVVRIEVNYCEILENA